MPQSKRPEQGWPAWWALEEWKRFSRAYKMHCAMFDQGGLGHPRPKPTTIATTSWALFESLDQMFLTKEERMSFGSGPQTTSERMQLSTFWGCWASGLTSRVLQAWAKWGEEQGLWSEVEGRQALLAKMTAEALQKAHEANDHVPYKKGCLICVAAQGRQRVIEEPRLRECTRRRLIWRGHVPGRCFDPVASGMDRGWVTATYATLWLVPLRVFCRRRLWKKRLWDLRHRQRKIG